MSISFRTRRRLNTVLEKLAASEALVANLVGAEGKLGRASSRAAKRFAKSTGSFDQTAYKATRGPKVKSDSAILSNQDKNIQDIRSRKSKLQKDISRLNETASTPEHYQEIEKAKEELRNLSKQETQASKAKRQEFKNSSGDNRARLESQINESRQRSATQKSQTQPNNQVSVDAFSGNSLSSGERAYLSNASNAQSQVTKQYQSMLNDKSFVESANKAIQENPQIANEYAAYMQRFGNQVTPQEFMARKNIQVQMRQAGNAQGRGVLFNNAPEGMTARTEMFKTSPSEGFFGRNTAAGNQGVVRQQAVTNNQINETMQSMHDAEMLSYNKKYGPALNEGQSVPTFEQHRQNVAVNTTNQNYTNQLNQKALEITKANPQINQQAAQAQAKTMIQQPQQPMTNLQSYQLKNLGTFQPAGNQVAPKSSINFGSSANGAPQIDFSSVNKGTQNSVNKARTQDLKQTATSQLSNDAKSNNSSGFFQGAGGYMLAGAGLLGAGYLYANSSNTQQPQPNQNGY